jgi:hypothetical protein
LYRVNVSKISLVGLLILAFFGLTQAAWGSPGRVRLSVRPLNPTTSQIVAQDVGTAANTQPAISWDIYFNFDHTQGRLASVTAGPAWDALGCGFAVNVTDGTGLPTPNDVVINGFCIQGNPPGVTGDEVVVATLNWAECRQPFLVDLRTGQNEFGGLVTDVIDVNNDPYQLMEADLFDGGACGNMTQGVQAAGSGSTGGTRWGLIAPLALAGVLLVGLGLWARRRAGASTVS